MGLLQLQGCALLRSRESWARCTLYISDRLDMMLSCVPRSETVFTTWIRREPRVRISQLLRKPSCSRRQQQVHQWTIDICLMWGFMHSSGEENVHVKWKLICNLTYQSRPDTNGDVWGPLPALLPVVPFQGTWCSGRGSPTASRWPDFLLHTPGHDGWGCSRRLRGAVLLL